MGNPTVAEETISNGNVFRCHPVGIYFDRLAAADRAAGLAADSVNTAIGNAHVTTLEQMNANPACSDVNVVDA